MHGFDQRNGGEHVAPRAAARDENDRQAHEASSAIAVGSTPAASAGRGRAGWGDCGLASVRSPAWLEMLSRMPAATAFTMSDEPPKLTKGRVRPLVGRTASATRQVHEGLDSEHGGQPEREERTEVVRRPKRRAHAPRHEQEIRAAERGDAEETQLFADDCRDEVRVRLGEIERLQPPAEAEPRGAARAERHDALEGLIGEVLPVLVHVQPGEVSLVAVLAEANGGGAERRAENRRAQDVAQLRAGDEEHREREKQQHDRAAEVRLLEAEEHEDAGDDEMRQKAHGERLHALGLLRERIARAR